MIKPNKSDPFRRACASFSRSWPLVGACPADGEADLENRSVTNVGAAALVIEPDDVPGDNFLASVEWADDRADAEESLRNGVFGVTQAQALDLVEAAKGCVFGSRGEAYDWLSRMFSEMSHYRPGRKLAA